MFHGIKDLQVGKTDDIIVLVRSISTLKMKSGEPYQKVIVRDQDGREATFIQFDALLKITPPAVVKARVEVVKYGASVSMKIRKCTECTETEKYGIGTFLPKPHINAKEAWSSVEKAVKSIRPGLARIVCAIISDNRNKFLSLPLNQTGAFARQSGILEATIMIMEIAEKCACTQGLDRDLLMAGAVLYYSGNFDTIDNGYNLTVADLMYGPSAVAAHKVQMKSMVLADSDEKAKNEISEEDVMMLCHILMARGNSVVPAIPEALALKHIDLMVHGIEEMNKALSDTEDMVSIDPNHFNRRLYKSKEMR